MAHQTGASNEERFLQDSNSKANASESLEDIFPRYFMHCDLSRGFESLSRH